MGHGTDDHLEHAQHAQHHAHDPFDRRVAVSMAIIAAILAAATMISHRGHTDTVRLTAEASIYKTESSDQWAFYQAKNIRSYQFQSDLMMLASLLPGEYSEAAQKIAFKRWYSQLRKYEGEDILEGDFGKLLKQMAAVFKVDLEPKAKQKNPEPAGAKKDDHGSQPGDKKNDHTSHANPKKDDPHGKDDSAGKTQGKKGELAEIMAKAKEYAKKSEEIQHQAHELHRTVDFVDIGHLGLELALVLCSVAVLTKLRSFWFAGILAAVLGTALAGYGVHRMIHVGSGGGEHHAAQPH